jgi:excisionase family DNA binding protein
VIPPEVRKLALSVEEAADCMSLAERAVWDLVGTGQLRSLKVGRRRIVPVSAIEEFLEREGAA